jgi:hypothetical protein
MTRIAFLLLALSIACGSFSQTAKLHLEIQTPEESECFEVTIYNNGDSVYSDRLYSYFYEEIDVLPPGTYRLVVTACADEDFTLLQSRYFVLYPDSVTHVDLNYESQLYRTADVERPRIYRTVTQLMVAYMNNNWAYNEPSLTSSASAGFGQSAWFPLSRNIGLLAGGGMTFTHSSIAKDTTFMHQSPLAKRYEYYNYLDLRADAAIRLSSKSQQADDFPGFTVDIGASYHLPLLFKHVARYGGNQKFMNGGLHEFTDCRVFLNVGYAPCLFFAEYRLLDFVLGSYPELPRWNFGLKIDIPQMFYSQSSYNR